MYANVVKIKTAASLPWCSEIVLEWCSEEEEDSYGITQIYFCAELIVVSNCRSICMGTFSSMAVCHQ